MTWRAKGAGWLRRYGVAEIVGTTAAITCSLLVRALTSNEVAAAYGGALGENLGYYGVIIAREIATDARTATASGKRYGIVAGIRTARNLAFEFGIAELADSAVLRPLAMGLGARYFGSEIGIVVGKLAADIVFYVPVLGAYELRRHMARLRAAGDN